MITLYHKYYVAKPLKSTPPPIESNAMWNSIPSNWDQVLLNWYHTFISQTNLTNAYMHNIHYV